MRVDLKKNCGAYCYKIFEKISYFWTFFPPLVARLLRIVLDISTILMFSACFLHSCSYYCISD